MPFKYIRPLSQALIAARPRRIRWRSSIHACQSGRFSIITHPSTSKQEVLDRIAAEGLNTSLKFSHGVSSRRSNAAVIFASRDLASWLEDVDFMSSLLHGISFNLPKDESGSHDVSVLAAVADGLCPPHPNAAAATGLSILHGQVDAILPGLWENSIATGRTRMDTPSAVSVAMSPLLGDFRSLNVTLPLANTVFQNGRRSTLLASRWWSDGTHPYHLAQMVEKDAQVIVPSLKSIQTYSSVSVPLFPITAPHRVLSGLGNIVRQVEISGQPSPASKELELRIPQLLEARSRASLDAVARPITVWALVIPQQAMGALHLEYDIDFKYHDSASEEERAERMARNSSSLLAAGCHLHRILSGGGGWGLKQGLLSLDPQTRYSVSGEEDIDSFISSFKGEATPESIVTPNSYIQFFVEPVSLSKPTSDAPSIAQLPSTHLPSIVFGTQPAATENQAYIPTETVQIIEDHFGAISSQGVIVDSISQSNSEVDRSQSTHTKIDAPYAYLWEGSKRWI